MSALRQFPARYANLLRLDGEYDRSVIARIAHATARAERDLEILVAARAPTSACRAVILGETRAWRAEAATVIDTRGLRLDPYSKHFARALADVWGFAKARRGNFKPAADVRAAA
jgi:hypothetical protein